MTTISTERPDTEVAVILGVDTHLDVHTAVAVDDLGRRLGEASVPTTAERVTRGSSAGRRVSGPSGAQGRSTSSYGAGLTRHLRARGIEVLGGARPEHRQPEARAATLRESKPFGCRSRRTGGFGRRSLGRTQERRGPRGDDQGPTCGPPFRD